MLSSALTAAVVKRTESKPQSPSKNEMVADFYNIENAVHVSPHSLRKWMDAGEKTYTLVDLRSQQEYEKSHVTGAVSIPAYVDPNHSIALGTDVSQTQRIIDSFKALPQDKQIIVYCYSTACMTGRKVGQLLANNGIYVQHLGIGWNEWRYSWSDWNHDSETPSKVEDHITAGKDPGTPKIIKDRTTPCGVGDFSC